MFVSTQLLVREVSGVRHRLLSMERDGKVE
jgi:hypothetical protein